VINKFKFLSWYSLLHGSDNKDAVAFASMAVTTFDNLPRTFVTCLYQPRPSAASVSLVVTNSYTLSMIFVSPSNIHTLGSLALTMLENLCMTVTIVFLPQLIIKNCSIT
jgi:hypothetical protein